MCIVARNRTSLPLPCLFAVCQRVVIQPTAFLKRGFKHLQLLLRRIHPILVCLSHTREYRIFLSSVQSLFKKSCLSIPIATTRGLPARLLKCTHRFCQRVSGRTGPHQHRSPTSQTGQQSGLQEAISQSDALSLLRSKERPSRLEGNRPYSRNESSTALPGRRYRVEPAGPCRFPRRW